MFEITVVIPTFNRPEQVKRSIESVLSQKKQDNRIEVMIVDDASTIDYHLAQYIDAGITYHKMPSNGGPNPCRMYGIEQANTPWVLLLDDDDVLLEGAIEYLASVLNHSTFTETAYPVYQFSTKKTNQQDFFIASIEHFFDGSIIGDQTMIIHKQSFLEHGFHFPDNKAGGEHLLWWHVADIAKIPTFNKNIVYVYDDADSRLTDATSQIKNAKNHQALAMQTLQTFGSYLKEKQPARYLLTRSGLVVYSLLANEKKRARDYLQQLELPTKLSWLLWGVSFLPISVIHILFKLYRRHQRKKILPSHTQTVKAQ